MQLTPENFKVSRLLRDIDDGKIALPEFQRDFVWRPPLVADMLRTLLRQWPPGTFLLLETNGAPEFAIKALAEAPPLSSEPRLLILDGQQRSTAIYQALRGRAAEVYYIHLKDVVDADEFDDDHLEYLKQSKYVGKYKNLKDEASAGIVRVATLWDDTEWQKWLRELPEEEQDRMVAARSKLLPGASEFEIPSVRLESDASLPAIAKIFETLNRRGMRLATFDLMVARLYPHGFQLRSKWEDALAAHPDFEDLGIEEGVDVLKVIALREHMLQREAGIKRTVKGIRESDVLSLPAATVIAQWDVAVQSMIAALRFVREECGVIRSGLMPSAAMLYPLADALAPDRPQREGLRDDLGRWFWATAFSQTYAQGANTRAVSDAQALRAWQVDPSALPDVLTFFHFEEDVLREGRARNEMILRGILCRSVVANARDWCEDKRFIDLPDPLQVHHVFPNEFLTKHYKVEKDPISNFALLTEATNKKLRNTLPKDVLARPDVYRDAIESHRIEIGTIEEISGEDSEESIRRFLESRVESLGEMIRTTGGAPVTS